MKKLHAMKYILLLMCLLGAACGARSYTVRLPDDLTAQSYTVWYSHKDTNMPFLAALERGSSTTHLALVFLQGKRFAHCIYTDNTLTCTLDEAVASASMQGIADTTARIIAHSLHPANPLPRGWEEVAHTQNHNTFAHYAHNSRLRIEKHSLHTEE